MSGVVAGVLETLTELPRVALVIGGAQLYDQEIPDSIRAGGEQMLGEHKYPGGVRTIDTFGPDDRDIEWSGRFLDLLAERRCQQFDVMRRQGTPVKLTWSSFAYAVIIRSFTWTYERTWQIQYSISLAVVQDLNNPPATQPKNTASTQVAADVVNAVTNVLTLANELYASIV